MLIYPVILEAAEEGGFVVTFPDVPDAITQGDNETEALMMAQDALLTMFDAYMQDRQAIPEASPIGGYPYVALPVISAGKIAIYNAMLAAGMNTADMANHLGINPIMAERLLSLRYKSRVEQIENALLYLVSVWWLMCGKRLNFHFKHIDGRRVGNGGLRCASSSIVNRQAFPMRT